MDGDDHSWTPEGKRTQLRGKEGNSPAVASEWSEPIWMLDLWTYETSIIPAKEFSKPAEDAEKESAGTDSSDDSNNPALRATAATEASKTVRVMRTRKNETSMILPVDRAPLAALCGRAGDEEDRRDVALAIAMAKMVSFLPFRGVRASPHSDRTSVRSLHCDHDPSQEPDSSDSDDDLPPADPSSGADLKTRFCSVFDADFNALIRAASFSPYQPFEQYSFEFQVAYQLESACGALGNLALLHSLLEEMENDQVEDEGFVLIFSFCEGAMLSDNPTSIDLLMRFPPVPLQQKIADFFHLSQGARQPLMASSKYSSLAWLTQSSYKLLPSSNEDVVWYDDLRRQHGDEIAEEDVGAKIPETSKSLFQARLVSNLMKKKSYPTCGGGYFDFPAVDLCSVYSMMARRAPKGGLARIGPGVLKSRVELTALAVQCLPKEAYPWTSLTFSMARTETVEIDLGPANGGKCVFSQVEAAVRALELELKLSADDPENDHSCAWNNVAYFIPTRDAGGKKLATDSVEILGKTYTRNECGHTALEIALKNRPFEQTSNEWDTLGTILLPPPQGQGDHEEETDNPGEGKRMTHFVDTRKDGSRCYSNLDCVLVALSINPKDVIYWFHIGQLLWKNNKKMQSNNKEDGGGGKSTYSVPSTVLRGGGAPLHRAMTKALREVDKTIADVETTLLPEDSVELIGAGGKECAFGPCGTVFKLTELECYLVAHKLDETKLLTDAVRDELEDAVSRLIQVLTPARISEKGRRVVEAQMETGSFEKSYSS